jgi:hypothetical protein
LIEHIVRAIRPDRVALVFLRLHAGDCADS